MYSFDAFTVMSVFICPPLPQSVLRLEYRSKLLNPKWAEAMAAQGSGGAYEISQRMTAMVGWGATTGFAEDWTWEQAAETYVMDEAMAAKLRDANPQVNPLPFPFLPFSVLSFPFLSFPFLSFSLLFCAFLSSIFFPFPFFPSPFPSLPFLSIPFPSFLFPFPFFPFLPLFSFSFLPLPFLSFS
jgi:hypothetical protein